MEQCRKKQRQQQHFVCLDPKCPCFGRFRLLPGINMNKSIMYRMYELGKFKLKKLYLTLRPSSLYL